MKRLSVLAIVTALLVSPASAQSLTAGDVVAKMSMLNESLASYKARIHFDIDLHAFITMHPALNATYYFKKPDKAALDFDTVPMIAQEFQHIYASLGSPSRWNQMYDISLTSNAGADPGRIRYVLKLIPRKSGNLDHSLVTVDDREFAIVRQEWFYHNGGTISMDEQNQRVGRYTLPKKQIAEFKLPSYQAHVISSFGDFKLNVPIPDSVFTQGGSQ